MFSRNIKLLGTGHYFKIILPVALFLTVFMLRGSISVYAESFFEKAFSNTKKSFDINIDSGNRDFIRALLSEPDFGESATLDFDKFKDNLFIMSMKNDIKTEEPAKVAKSSKNKDKDEKQKVEPAPDYSLTTIFRGSKKQFAVVNDKIYRINDSLPSGEKVVLIESGKILLKGKWGKRWLYVKY
jgi:hypothetical protein